MIMSDLPAGTVCYGDLGTEGRVVIRLGVTMVAVPWPGFLTS